MSRRDPSVRLATVVLAAAVFYTVTSPWRSAGAAAPPASEPASKPGQALPLTPPDPDSVRAYDRTGDDGSVVIVEWAKPDHQAPGAWYVVEMTDSEKDLQEGKPGKVHVWKVEPLESNLKSSEPKYFGVSKSNETRYFAAISPALAVQGAGARPLAVERIRKLVDTGVVPAGIAKKAVAALRNEKPDKELTDEEKALREWVGWLKVHLAVAETLQKLVGSEILRQGDADAVVAALANTKASTDAGLTEAEKADRKWLGRLKAYGKAVLGAKALVDEGIFSEADIADLAAALRNRKGKDKLTKKERTDRGWLAYLSLHLPLAGKLRALQAKKLFGNDDFARAKAALANRTPYKELSDEEKARRDWLGRLGNILPLLLSLEKLVGKDVLGKEEMDRIRPAVRNAKPDDDLSEDQKGARQWLDRIAEHRSVLLKLDDFVEKGFIEDHHAERIVTAVRNSKPDDALTGREAADRRWLTRVRAHIDKKTQEDAKAHRRKLNRKAWHFRVAVTDGKQKVYIARDGKPVITSAAARPNLFKRFLLNNLVFALAFSAFVLAFIWIARRNPNLFIRKIAGLEAIEEAIGRATEMGRSVYFVHGLGALGGLPTIAALNILGRVARRSAEYDIRLRVLNNNPMVTLVSQEVVQQAFTEAGRPDAYNADDVSFVASDQFSYVAAVAGMMVREQPAAIFLMGDFFAESLLLAETGASTGAIQVAGTNALAQLPFFITTCDYTLIGEELYAASAYLSREPKMLGSLRGQDVGKAFLMVVMVVGVIVLTTALAFGWELAWLRNLVRGF